MVKLSVGVLLLAIAVVHAATIDSEDVDVPPSKVIVSSSLFESAWQYQLKFESLQQDINTKLTAIRTAVSTVLAISSNHSLAQIEGIYNGILDLDRPARDRIYDLDSSLCVINLRVLINAITEFSGFYSSNCVTEYDKKVQEVLDAAYAIVHQYEGSSAEVQQTVVKSFIKRNAILKPDEIEARFKELYEIYLKKWSEFFPNVEEFVENLQSQIGGFNNNLQHCFNDLREQIGLAYFVLQQEIATCDIFDRTVDPFAVFLAYNRA